SRGREQVDTSGLIFLLAVRVDDLNFVADVSGRPLQLGRQRGPLIVALADDVVRPRAVAYGDSAISVRRDQVFDVKIELAELGRGVKPGLTVQPGLILFLVDGPGREGI